MQQIPEAWQRLGDGRSRILCGSRVLCGIRVLNSQARDVSSGT